MKTQKIFSKNADYQKFEVLKTNRNKRHKYGEFFAEGVRSVNEAIKNGWQINSFIYSFEKPLSRWAENIIKAIPVKVNYEVPSNLMKDLSGKEDTSELLAVINMKEDKRQINYSKNPVIALFDRPSNKGNLGTMLRSCDAFGVECLIITGHSVDIYDPDVISSSMGSFFKVPFIRLANNSEINEYITKMKNSFPEFKVVGTTAHKRININEADLSTPVMFLIGNETDGLNHHLSQISDISVTIPMSADSSASSFNVSCAATVMFYETARQRGFTSNL